MRVYITLILMALLLIVAFVFGSQNDQIITLNYLIAKTQITVAEAVSLFSLIGLVFGLLLAMLWKLLRAVKPKKQQATQ